MVDDPAVGERRRRFRALHEKGRPFVMANAWDEGSARILQSLGFPAVATSSAGYALTRGRRDYGVTRADAIAHGAAMADAVDVPVSADLENGFGPGADDARATIAAAAASGLCGGSIEDFSGDTRAPILDAGLSAERIAAAAQAARGSGFVLTARAEAFLHGGVDLKEVIARLQRYQEAGADVLFAPGLPDLGAVKTVCAAVDAPVSILVAGRLMAASLEDLAEAGAARISLGNFLASCAYGALYETAAIIARDRNFTALANNAAGAKALRKALR